MSVRRMTTRFAMVRVVLAGLVVAGVTIGAAPAVAQEAREDSVRLRVSNSFTAGGKAGAANVTVTRRSAGCVVVRTALAIGLPGLAPDQVLVQLNSGRDQLRTLALSSGGDGLVVTGRVAPERPELCERRSVSVRYRVTFLATAPGGQATMVAEAYTAGGRAIAAQTDTARVSSRNGVVTPSRPAAPTSTPTPSPEPSVVEEAQDVEVTVRPTPAVAGAGAGRPVSDGGFFGMATMVMLFGVAMVGIGAALLVLLVRRGRAERATAGPGGYPGDGGDATQILPRMPR